MLLVVVLVPVVHLAARARRDRVRIGAVARREHGIVVPVLRGVTGRYGGHDGRGRVFAGVFHAQLQEHIFQRAQAVEREQVLRRLLREQMAGAHQSDLKKEERGKRMRRRRRYVELGMWNTGLGLSRVR